MTAQLVARAVRLAHGPVVVLDGVDLTVAPGDRIGLVGPNGVGKSTLLQVLAGRMPPDSGTVERVPSAAVVTLLDQERDLRDGETSLAYLSRRTGVTAAERELADAAAAISAGARGAGDRYVAALDRYSRVGAAELDARAEPALERVGLEPARLEQPTSTLSGGQRARLALAATLLARADVLLLDEPTNDLDLDGLELLEALLSTSTSGFVVVSHDRAFLERTVTSVVELDEHARTASRFSGGWAAFLDERRLARAHAERDYAEYVDRRATLAERARRERRWAAKGVREARTRSTDNDKFITHHRISTSEQLAARAARTERAMERLDPVGKPWQGWELRLSFAAAPPSGAVAAALQGAILRRGGFTLGPVDLVVGGGERVAVTGANGAGKSTLLAALLGDVELDAGARRLGPSVVVGRLDQARGRLDGPPSLLEAWCEETGASAVDARTRLAKVGLGAEHVRRPASRLSPGERTRAVLAAFAETGVNLLVLDEPTNHLDLPGIEQLERALDRFLGTVLLVSHDRALLDAVRVDRRIVVAGGRVVGDTPVAAGADPRP